MNSKYPFEVHLDLVEIDVAHRQIRVAKLSRIAIEIQKFVKN